MRVLFLQDVVNVANAGEIKEVASGFARNYLLPKKLATVATPEETKRVARIKRQAEDQRTTETAQWQAMADKLDGTTLHLTGRVGPTGQYYGAISVTRIIQELAATTGEEVERRTVELSEPIREPGKYQVSLRFHQSVSALITIVTTAEGQATELFTEDEELETEALAAVASTEDEGLETEAQATVASAEDEDLEAEALAAVASTEDEGLEAEAQATVASAEDGDLEAEAQATVASTEDAELETEAQATVASAEDAELETEAQATVASTEDEGLEAEAPAESEEAKDPAANPDPEER